MAEPDPLPTEQQRHRLCAMMAAAFVEIRWLGWGGHAQQAADLAEAFHNLPQEMYGVGLWQWAIVREDLQRYQQKYEFTRDYVAMLDEIKALAG